MTQRTIAVCVMVAALAGASTSAQQPAPPVRGPEKAAEVEVFLSFAEAPSAQASVVLDALVERHPESVRVVFRHVVAEDNTSAVLVHRAAYAAGAQSRFWEMAQLLFANQDRHERTDLLGMAAQLRLDVQKFARDLDAADADRVFTSDRARARALGITAAPMFVVKGARVQGPRSLDELEALVK